MVKKSAELFDIEGFCQVSKKTGPFASFYIIWHIVSADGNDRCRFMELTALELDQDFITGDIGKAEIQQYDIEWVVQGLFEAFHGCFRLNKFKIRAHVQKKSDQLTIRRIIFNVEYASMFFQRW